MRHPEKAIEKVLAGLRDVESPPGLERRILEAVEGRASVLSSPALRPGSLRWALSAAHLHATRPWATRIALVSFISVFLISFLIFQHEQSLAHRKPHLAPPGSPPKITSPGAVQYRYRLAPGAIPPHRSGAHMSGARLSANAESVALREMRAPSHPAPAEPLTQQERLLLRIVHTGDPEEMAMLNPDIRAEQETESAAEFRKFVEQSIKGDRE